MHLSKHGYLWGAESSMMPGESQRDRSHGLPLKKLERPRSCPIAHPRLMPSCQRNLTWYRYGAGAQRALCLEKSHKILFCLASPSKADGLLSLVSTVLSKGVGVGL